MRRVLTTACKRRSRFAFTTSATAASNGHWICTGDGIKSWTTNLAAMDAAGWKYEGPDRTSYKDSGKCTKGVTHRQVIAGLFASIGLTVGASPTHGSRRRDPWSPST